MWCEKGRSIKNSSVCRKPQLNDCWCIVISGLFNEFWLKLDANPFVRIVLIDTHFLHDMCFTHTLELEHLLDLCHSSPVSDGWVQTSAIQGSSLRYRSLKFLLYVGLFWDLYHLFCQCTLWIENGIYHWVTCNHVKWYICKCASLVQLQQMAQIYIDYVVTSRLSDPCGASLHFQNHINFQRCLQLLIYDPTHHAWNPT